MRIRNHDTSHTQKLQLSLARPKGEYLNEHVLRAAGHRIDAGGNDTCDHAGRSNGGIAGRASRQEALSSAIWPQKVYEDYVAVSGHSAYAQTPLRDGVEAFFCGRTVNAPSQKVAEERALENCRSVGKRYKVKIAGACAIYVSK